MSDDLKHCNKCGQEKPRSAFQKYRSRKDGLHYWCRDCANKLQRPRSPTRLSWVAMKERCYRTTHENYPQYGGRGISVCERWRKSFKNFLADMGERPAGMTLDRYPNTEGNYEPGNCRWATMKQQQRNRKDRVQYEAFGKRQTLPEWAEEYGLPVELVRQRITKYRWPLVEALTMTVVTVHGTKRPGGKVRVPRTDLPA